MQRMSAVGRSVGLLVCRSVGLSVCRSVGLSVCRSFGLSCKPAPTENRFPVVYLTLYYYLMSAVCQSCVYTTGHIP